jgi:hypothetical protein
MEQDPRARQNEVAEMLLHEINSGKCNASSIVLDVDPHGFLEEAFVSCLDKRGKGNDLRIRLYFLKDQSPEAISEDIIAVFEKEKPISHDIFFMDGTETKEPTILALYYKVAPIL